MWIVIFAAFLIQDTTAARQDIRPQEVGVIADAVIDTVLPCDRRLGTLTVAQRGIRFDAARTDMALRRVASSNASPERLAMHRHRVTAGDSSLLADCDPSGRRPCQALQKSAYVWMDQVEENVRPDQVRLRVHVAWAEPMAPTPRRSGPFLTSFTGIVTLARDRAGAWKVVELGPHFAG